MYEYRDTTTISDIETASLPVEAVSIDGVYIENIIDGYRTLYTSGRESLEKEFEKYDTTRMDGEQVNFTRFPSRTIKVGFQLICGNSTEFRETLNDLNELMNVENVQIIFNDETDKYFIGSPIFNAEFDTGVNSVTGEYEIYCADPFKYELIETSVTPSAIVETSGVEAYDNTRIYEQGEMVLYDDKVYVRKTTASSAESTFVTGNWSVLYSSAIVFDNEGGYTTYPKFKIQFADDVDSSGVVGDKGNCGFVQIAKRTDSETYRLQFGDDSETETKSANVFSYDFKTSIANMTAVTSGTLPYFKYATVGKVDINKTYGMKTSYGSGTSIHGGYAYKGVTSMRGFKLEWSQLFATAVNASVGKKQQGVAIVAAFDASNNVICAVELIKNKNSNTKGTINYYVGDYESDTSTNWVVSKKFSKDIDFKVAGNFGYTVTSKTTTKVVKNKKGKKTKKKVTTYTYTPKFKTNSITREIDADGTITMYFKTAYSDKATEKYIVQSGKYTQATRIGVFMGQNAKQNVMTSNFITTLKLINTEYNTFQTNDMLEVDCADASVYLNNVSSPDLGDVGNEWSDFYLDTNENTIILACSDWVTSGYEPSITMTTRRRWL